jgi:hypothetical protein
MISIYVTSVDVFEKSAKKTCPALCVIIVPSTIKSIVNVCD